VRKLTGDAHAQYKTTLFDRHGPAAADYVRAFSYGLMVLGLSLGGFTFASGGISILVVMMSFGAAVATGLFSLGIAKFAESSVRALIVNGSSTPYKEQYSYQQALVMQGKVDEALASFQAVIAERPERIDARIRAAELYACKQGRHARAAQVFREALDVPTIAAGEEIYIRNRLADLYTGELRDPGRALLELRRLIDKYPQSAAAEHARAALVRLKADLVGQDSL